MTTSALRKWSWAHKWSSIICTLFMLMLCITGLPLIFHDEIDELLHDQVAAAVVPEGTPRRRISIASWRALWRRCRGRCLIS